MINIEIKSWTSHHNHFLYSILHYTSFNGLKFNISLNESLPASGIIMRYNNKTVFLDYSDDFVFLANPDEYDFYFKRSLKKDETISSVLPLNFQVNLAYKPFMLLLKMPFEFNFIKKSSVEIVRAIDFFKITNMSHFSMLVNKFNSKSTDSNGRIIFCTRLWDPNKSSDSAEKQRREAQNYFRINACKIIKNNYPNSFVGIFDSELARNICPELIFKSKILSKKKYFAELLKSDICIADDGLKDSAGWKIGEYLMFGKAVITTPLNVKINDFSKGVNYLELNSRTAIDELPQNIDFLLEDKKYREMCLINKEWSEKYLFPNSYIENILKHL